MAPSLQVFIRRDSYKFSAAHMTVFADGSKERLHGHNFQVELRVELASVGFSPSELIPFGELKEQLRLLVSPLDERLLLAERCPQFRVLSAAGSAQLDFELCGARYSLPATECLLLPLENITSESLAFYLGSSLAERLRARPYAKQIKSLVLRIEEGQGQGAEWGNG